MHDMQLRNIADFSTKTYGIYYKNTIKIKIKILVYITKYI